jgi:hypothetical protein
MASVVITNSSSNKVRSVSTIDYPKTNVLPSVRLTKINEVLPFRIKLTNIGIPSAYSNIPGIGLQIIGINNYIL